MTDPVSFDQRAKARINRTVEAVNASWFPGAPYDPIPFARFNAELVAAERSRVLSRVEKACAKFEGHMVRKLTIAKLEAPAKPKPKAPQQAELFAAPGKHPGA